MSDTYIFVFGLIVTLIVVLGYGTLIWAAIEDGRAHEQAEERAEKVAEVLEEAEGV